MKYDKDYQDNLKWLSSVLEAADQTKIETLKVEVGQINDQKTSIKQAITELESKKSGLVDIAGRSRRVNQQLTDLETNYNSTSKTKAKTSFLGNATGKYDWETKTKAYYPITYFDNLYQGTVNGTQIKITEQEAIKLLTRVIKAWEKVEATKFNTKFTASTHTTGTNHLPAIQKLAKDGLKSNEIIGKDATGSDLPDKGKPANHATLNRLEYSFKSQFVADTDIQKTPTATAFTPQSTETIDKTKVDNFFAFINTISQNGTIKPEFLTELQADTTILQNIENNTSWKILPAQSNALEASKLADYGIKVANDNHTKLYLSELDLNKAVKFNITEGLKSWVELVWAFFTDANQQTKLATSFTADPYIQLLTDLGNNAHQVNWELPESKEDLQKVADELELAKISAATTIGNLTQEVDKKKSDLTAKETEFTSKDTELTTLLAKIITKKREELNKFNIKEFDNQTDSGGSDNRKTQSELWKISLLLYQIRYLENDGDASLASSLADENTALTTIEDLNQKILHSWGQSHWNSIGWDSSKSETENRQIANSVKIALIKAKKNHIYVGGLTYYYDGLVELEKLIKLTEEQVKIKTDLKAAIDQKSPEENLQEWRDTLKTVEADLATAFTDAKITEWKAKKDGQAQFDNTASIKSLLEKVKGDDKFIEFIKSKAAAIDTLAKLIEHKEPTEVIKLITRWTEYEKLTEAAKKTKKQQLVWTLEKKGEDGKYLDDTDLTDEEIANTLYQIAIGKKTLASQKKADGTTDDQTNPSPSPTPKGHFSQYWWAYLLGITVIGGGLVAIFWKKISEWWKGPGEETDPAVKETEKVEADIE